LLSFVWLVWDCRKLHVLIQGNGNGPRIGRDIRGRYKRDLILGRRTRCVGLHGQTYPGSGPTGESAHIYEDSTTQRRVFDASLLQKYNRDVSSGGNAFLNSRSGPGPSRVHVRNVNGNLMVISGPSGSPDDGIKQGINHLTGKG
jgi:hypothetical protein